MPRYKFRGRCAYCGDTLLPAYEEPRVVAMLRHYIQGEHPGTAKYKENFHMKCYDKLIASIPLMRQLEIEYEAKTNS